MATIIIPVYNSPHLAENAILSTQKAISKYNCPIIVYDDGSDYYTKSMLNALAQNRNTLNVYHQQKNKGYINTVNSALSICKTKYAVLVNSDVVLTEGCIDTLIETAESDSRIATVNPLTNNASHIDIPLPPGINIFEMNDYLNKKFQGTADIVTGVGFCMLLRMKAVKQVGMFDEIYGNGYCEESDFCMRLTTNGWRTVVTLNAYVYHKGQGSFENKREQYLKNRRLFDQRWNKEYKAQFKKFQKKNPLGTVRDKLRSPHRVAPLVQARQVYRRVSAHFRKKDFKKVHKEIAKAVIEIKKVSIPTPTSAFIKKFKSNECLSVTYLLPYITVAGGVISVIQLVNELILLGVDARIATLRKYPEMNAWPLYTAPMIFKNYKDMEKGLPETDIVVATHWSTAHVAHNMKERHIAKETVYFVQDFEPWFYPKKDTKKRSFIENTYRLLPNKIVKSEWLKQKLFRFGGDIKKIHIGMDLRIFYPRIGSQEKKNQPVSIFSMARPRTPRRGFTNLVEGLSIVKKIHPDVRIRLFGDYLNNTMIPFAFEDIGIVADQNKLAKLYSEATLFIDASDFQGFGRTAMEAMACGTPCVLTSQGGVGEYARNEHNALLISPKTPSELSTAVCRLINDQNLRNRLSEKGQQTAKKFCHKREAKETADLFFQLVDKPLFN